MIRHPIIWVLASGLVLACGGGGQNDGTDAAADSFTADMHDIPEPSDHSSEVDVLIAGDTQDEVFEPPCQSEDDCVDDNDCTLDVCHRSSGTCVHVNECSPCLAHEDQICKELVTNPYEDPLCWFGHCVGPGAIGKVFCEETDPCPDGYCVDVSPGIGVCIIANCTFSLMDCTNTDPCINSWCDGGVCVHEEKSCTDGNPCTEDSCGVGWSTRSYECTHKTISCDDGIPCTLDTCDPDDWDGDPCHHEIMPDCNPEAP